MAFEEGASFGVTPSSGAALSPTLTFCVGYQERWAPVGDNDQPQRVSEFYWRSNCCWGHTEQQFEETLVTLFLSDCRLFFDSSLTWTEIRFISIILYITAINPSIHSSVICHFFSHPRDQGVGDDPSGPVVRKGQVATSSQSCTDRFREMFRKNVKAKFES